MKYEEFLKRFGLKETSKDYKLKNEKSYRAGVNVPIFLEVEWTTGGVSGGSCWDDGTNGDQHYAMEGEKEPEFDSLDNIIEELCPNIGFFQYKRLCQELVKYHSYTENEYYGNSTSYGYKRVIVKDLYEYLVEHNLISAEENNESNTNSGVAGVGENASSGKNRKK